MKQKNSIGPWTLQVIRCCLMNEWNFSLWALMGERKRALVRTVIQILGRKSLTHSPGYSRNAKVCHLDVLFIYLFIWMANFVKNFHPLDHSPNGCNSHGFGRLKTRAWNSIQVSYMNGSAILSHLLLPSHKRKQGSEVEQLGPKSVLIRDANITGGSLTFCTTRQVLSLSLIINWVYGVHVPMRVGTWWGPWTRTPPTVWCSRS